MSETELYGPGGPLEIYAEQLLNGAAVPRPKTPAYAVITQVFANAASNIFKGADPQAELDTATDKIDADLEENNYYEPS